MMGRCSRLLSMRIYAKLLYEVAIFGDDEADIPLP